jgi:hypothetical protein
MQDSTLNPTARRHSLSAFLRERETANELHSAPEHAVHTRAINKSKTNASAVSWQWGGGAPGGEVAEVKKQGEIAVTSKKGNTIKKNASPDNPGVHVKRSGNDVVKRASELNVEKKANKGSGGAAGGKRKKASADDDDDEEKKDADEKDEDEDEEAPLEKNKDGKEVKKGGKDAQSAAKANGAKKAKTEEKKETNGAKKGGGSGSGAAAAAKKSAGAEKKDEKKEKKPTKSREEGGVSARTRSRAK